MVTINKKKIMIFVGKKREKKSFIKLWIGWILNDDVSTCISSSDFDNARCVTINLRLFVFNFISKSLCV